MIIALIILGIVTIICATALIGGKMDYKAQIEKEKLNILKNNPEMFRKMFKE